MIIQDWAESRISRRGFVLALAALTLIALILRIWGIDLRSISHPEVYVPGIQLAEGISKPPPRENLGFTLWWHFHDEPHPIGWYLAMFGWTEIFGTSHTAIRLPAAILGALTIPFVGLIGALVWGRAVGLISAGAMTLHGFHLYWSQAARMYSPGVFFAVLSTFLLILLIRRRAPAPGLEAGYVLACFCGIQSVELFWPILLLQVLWLALISDEARFNGVGAMLRRPWEGASRLVQVQSISLMLAVPSLAHSAYRARTGAGAEPSNLFLIDFAAFGFLFTPDDFTSPPLSIPLTLLALLAVLAVAFAFMGWRAPSLPTERPAGGPASVPPWVLLVTFGLSAAIMIAIGLIAHKRNALLLGMTVLSFLSLGLPAIAGAVRALMSRFIPRYEGWRTRVAPAPLLFGIYSILATLALFSVSFVVSVLAERAWMVFVPFYVLLISAGVFHLIPPLRRAMPITVGLLGVLALASVPYSWQRPGTPQDYQGIAEVILSQRQPGDMVMIRRDSWVDTPIMYYLGPNTDYLVQPWRENIRQDGSARVWRVFWPGEGAPFEWDRDMPNMTHYRLVNRVDLGLSAVELYSPGTGVSQ